MKIAVLASGNGSNFEVIAQAIKDKKLRRSWFYYFRITMMLTCLSEEKSLTYLVKVLS